MPGAAKSTRSIVSDGGRIGFGWLSRFRFTQSPNLRKTLHQFPLVILAATCALGVVIGNLLTTTPVIYWCAYVGVVAACVYGTLIQRGDFSWSFVAVLFVPVFASWQAFVIQAYDSASILSIADNESTPAIIEATVDRPAILRRHPLADSVSRKLDSPWQTLIEVDATKAKVGREFNEISGRIYVVANGDLTNRQPGDQIRIYGYLRKFTPPTNPGERDLRDVYRRRGLHCRMDVESPDHIELIESGNAFFARTVAKVGAYGRNQLLAHTTQSTGPLAIALVIGQREFVDSQTRDRLLVTGTAHLLSVSGLHLAIIVLLAKMVSMLAGMPEKMELAWILFVCVAYVAITGGRPPVMRAALLVGGLLLAVQLRRTSQPINTLAFAAIVLLFLNPHNLNAIGVQLSFLAVATLLMCGRKHRYESTVVARAKEQEDRLARLAEGSRSWPIRYVRHFANTVKQACWFSLCVTVISAPLVWYHFHVVSPISVVTNVCLSPLLVFALGSGVATVAFGWQSTVGGWCGSVCSFFLSVMDWIIRCAASIPFGHFWLPSPPGYWVAVFYAVLVLLMFAGDSKSVRRARYGWIVLWGAIAWLMATWTTPTEPGCVEATFVDVGHGTSVILRFDDDTVWLYDCGRLANESHSSRDIDVALWSIGVTRLDGVFLSHADSDHYNALPGLIERFSIKQIVTSPGMLQQDEGGSLRPIRSAIHDAEIDVREVCSGDTVMIGTNRIHVLHPTVKRVAGSDNANSLVLSIQSGGHELLLPGDLESPGTEMLINQPRPKPGGVIMAPHHGSLSTHADAVLRWARPREVIVSGGKRAKRPEVAEMLAVTGSNVHVTYSNGAIRVLLGHDGSIQVQNWNHDPW